MKKFMENAQGLLESLWAILKGYRKAAEKCPNTCHQAIGEEAELPSGYWQKIWQFLLISFEVFFYIYKKTNSH